MRAIAGAVAVMGLTACGIGEVTMTAPASAIAGSTFEVVLHNTSGGQIEYNCCFISFSAWPPDAGAADEKDCTAEAYGLANGASRTCPVTAPNAPGRYSLQTTVTHDQWRSAVGASLDVLQK